MVCLCCDCQEVAALKKRVADAEQAAEASQKQHESEAKRLEEVRSCGVWKVVRRTVVDG